MSWDDDYAVKSVAIASAAVAALTELLWSSHPGRLFSEDLMFFGVTVVEWLVFLGAAAAHLWSRREKRSLRLVLGVLACSVGVAALCVWTLVPLRARVLLSEPWLRPAAVAAVRRVRIGRPTANQGERIALFSFERSIAFGKTVFLSTGPSGWFSQAGILYTENPAELAPLHVAIEHLYGPWWRYTEDVD